MLSDFFRINLPYGIAKNEKGEWMAFNREYLPIGFNNSRYKFDINTSSEYPVHTKYSNLKEATLQKLAEEESAINRDNNGNICTVWLYSDATNPTTDPQYWERYFKKLQRLSKLKID